MIKGFIVNVIEFLLGFFLVPVIVGIVSGLLIFLLPSLAKGGFQFVAYSLVLVYILKGIVLILLFKIRKMIAIGYLASIILDIIGFSILSLIDIPLSVS